MLNRCYLCPVCGEVWAKIYFGNAEWRPVTRGCAAHQYFTFERNGSLLEDWRTDIVAFPPEALKKEFLYALKLWEGGNVFVASESVVDPLSGFNPLQV